MPQTNINCQDFPSVGLARGFDLGCIPMRQNFKRKTRTRSNADACNRLETDPTGTTDTSDTFNSPTLLVRSTSFDSSPLSDSIRRLSSVDSLLTASASANTSCSSFSDNNFVEISRARFQDTPPSLLRSESFVQLNDGVVDDWFFGSSLAALTHPYTSPGRDVCGSYNSFDVTKETSFQGILRRGEKFLQLQRRRVGQDKWGENEGECSSSSSSMRRSLSVPLFDVDDNPPNNFVNNPSNRIDSQIQPSKIKDIHFLRRNNDNFGMDSSTSSTTSRTGRTSTTSTTRNKIDHIHHKDGNVLQRSKASVCCVCVSGV